MGKRTVPPSHGKQVAGAPVEEQGALYAVRYLFGGSALGDAMDEDAQSAAIRAVGGNTGDGTRVIQVHSSVVRLVKDADKGSTLGEADGMVYRMEKGVIESPSLFVRTADCVPVIAFDLDAGVIGIIHSGWKGTLFHIATSLVGAMVAFGASPERLKVRFGPAIRGCCYTVDKDRAERFRSEFPSVNGAVKTRKDNAALELTSCIRADFRKMGVSERNIVDSGICTQCEDSGYHSWRRDGNTDRYGENVSVVRVMRRNAK